MATTPKKKAGLISARELPKVVESAVKAATARLGGAQEKGGIVVKWELVGRRVRDYGQGQKFAEAVTDELSKSGIAATPAVLGIGKEIICGFIEPPNLPQFRDL